MSDPRDHEAYGGHNDGHALPRASGDVSKSMPDFSGKITGRNAPENNWEDQRSVDNHFRNLYDIDSANYGRPVGPSWPKEMDQ